MRVNPRHQKTYVKHLDNLDPAVSELGKLSREFRALEDDENLQFHLVSGFLRI